jgi:hypothetical protein
MSLSGLLLGLINIAIVVASGLIGYVIMWILGLSGSRCRRGAAIYMVIVATDCGFLRSMALLLGMPIASPRGRIMIVACVRTGTKYGQICRRLEYVA